MKLTKRRKFVVSSALLSLSFVGINFLSNQYRLFAIGGLLVFTAILFVWSLSEGLRRNATLLTLVLPVLFTLGVGLFWFLLPATIFARIPIVIFYGLGLYALLLTSNIYTVSTIRNIALMRAAKGVGFLLTLLTGFLLFDAILSVKAQIYTNTAVVFLISLPLFLQGLWSSSLKASFAEVKIFPSLLYSFSMAQIASLLYFWPVSVVVGSLFLTVTLYVLLGLGQAHEEARLFKNTIREYVSLGIIVFLAMILATNWRGF